MHEVLVNRLGGLSLPRKSVVRLTDRPDMTLGVYRGRKTTKQKKKKKKKKTSQKLRPNRFHANYILSVFNMSYMYLNKILFQPMSIRRLMNRALSLFFKDHSKILTTDNFNWGC